MKGLARAELGAMMMKQYISLFVLSLGMVLAPPGTAESVLSDWASDIGKLLHLVETTTHLINKENMTK